VTQDVLLDATGVVKRYGAVTALRNASLSVKAGEVHALMGANGAGKSTLVKILTGAVRADGGKITIRDKALAARSPAEARRAGLVSVYQEPALVPDLDIAGNLRLTQTPVDRFQHWVKELGMAAIDLRDMARDVPLAVLRVLDLARALAIEPDVLLLDEMTAALPSNLADRVMEVVRRQAEGGRSIIFISHRMLEIAALCNRATVLRDGETVGVVDIGTGAEERIVELMLGARIDQREDWQDRRRQSAASNTAKTGPVLEVRNLESGAKLRDVTFDLDPGEVLGVVGLEGQGQDELFSILAGAMRPASGTIAVNGAPVAFRHPADAIAAGIAFVPGDRAEALLKQRSVRENIALPFSARVKSWGPIPRRSENSRIDGAIERLQIDIRAQAEVQRLSGGNQQKVTIARWIAVGSRLLLCFDPTRGIDIRTKQQIYALLRELAAQGVSVLLYTSELAEIRRACDRTIVIFGGKVVDTLPLEQCDEASLIRAAHGLPHAVAQKIDRGSNA
jgi:ribose transport system ATP-binding protein